MVLNATQIEEVLRLLNQVSLEQKRILEDTKQVVLNDLSGCWECYAQQAFADAFISLEQSTLSQISALITLFETAFKQASGGLHQVNIDLAKMNSWV